MADENEYTQEKLSDDEKFALITFYEEKKIMWSGDTHVRVLLSLDQVFIMEPHQINKCLLSSTFRI